MTDKARLKESLKKILRALLLSAPLGLTPKELENDFREVEGAELPYRKLGYNTVNDLLQDMPDVVETTWNRGELVIRGKADHTTAHIKSLVSRQKVDVSKALKKRAAVERRASRPSFGASAGGRPRSGAPGVKPRGPRFGVRPTVPAPLQREIKSFLIAHPNGVLNTEFELQFGRKFGHSVPYSKMGFSSLRDLTMSMSDSISVEMLSRGRYRIYEKSNHPGRNKGSSSASRSQGFSARSSGVPLSSTYRQEPGRSANLPRSTKPVSPSPIRTSSTASSRPDAASRPLRSTHSNNAPSGFNRVQDVPPRLGGGQGEEKPSTRNAQKDTRSQSATKDDRGAVKGAADDESDETFGKDFLKEIQEIMELNPDGIMAASLPTAYKQHTGKELPMFSLGFYSVVELVFAMPSIVTVEREDSHGDWTLYDARTRQPKPGAESPVRSPKKNSSSSQDEMLNFDELKNRIFHTLKNHRDGLLLQDLPDEYERVNHTPFPMEQLGFHDVDSVVLLMQDIINISYKGRDNVYLYPVEGGIPPPPRARLNHRASLPADAVGFGPRFKPALLPALEEYVEVFVATVFTPHKISLNLKDAAMNDALEDLMNDLESVYCYAEGDHYDMPETMIAVDQVCCALFHEDSNWHRAVIIGIPNIDLVEVLYVDYGTVASVPKASLRLLKSCYMKLPIQAIDAKLCAIAPIGEKWTRAAQARLLQLTINKTLICRTTAIKDNVASVLLTDTSTDEDIHINDALVEEGHARFITVAGEEVTEGSDVQNPTDAYTTATFDIDSYDRAEGPPALEYDDEHNVGPNGDNEEHDDRKRSTPPGLPDVSHEDRTNNLQDAKQFFDKDAGLETNSTSSELNPTASPFQPKSGSASDTDSEIREINKEIGTLSLDEEFDIRWSIKCYELADQWLVNVVLGPPDDAYMLTDEVAALLETPETEGEGLNILANLILELGDAGSESEIYNLTKADAPGLFDELVRAGVTLNSIAASDLIMVQVISMTNALLILASSGSLSVDFLSQMQEMQAKLNGSPTAEEEEKEQEKDDLVVTLEELVRYMKCLEINRKRCLDAMMASGGTQYVDELQEIESTIAVIKEKIEEIHTSNSEASLSPKSPLLVDAKSLAAHEEPVIDIPAGHPAPYMDESPRTKLTQIVQPILQPLDNAQVMQAALGHPVTRHARSHPVWSSGYDSTQPIPNQPPSYTLQSSVTLQQSIPPQFVQYSIQPVPPHQQIIAQPPPNIRPPGPQTPPRRLINPNIPPPPLGMPPPHIRMHPPPSMGPPMVQRGPPNMGGPPPNMGGSGSQQYMPGVGRGVGPAWQY